MEIIQILEDSGADMVEIGVPFSDPVADGPVIQKASHEALNNGVKLKKILDAVSKLHMDIPLLAMSYLNPLLAYGRDTLLSDMIETGVSGLIVPDLPVDASDGWVDLSQDAGIDLIFLAAPTSPDDRIRRIVKTSRGFIYCVSVTGTTGIREGLAPNISEFLGRIKSASNIPVAVGFGVSGPEHVRSLRDHADGVIVGSRIIRAVMENENLERLINDLKDATRRGQEKTGKK
jgi:tryptophan synthase alpha chain